MLLSSFGSMISVWWKYYRMASYSALGILSPEHHSFKLSNVLHASLSLPSLLCVPMTAIGLMGSFSEGHQNCFSRTVSNQPVASLASLGRCGFSSVAALRIPSAGRDTSMMMMMMYFWMGDFAVLRTPHHRS